MRDSFLSKTRLNRCNGFTFPHYSEITSEELDEWRDHMLHQNGWDDDLICAWESRKIAMIENDFYPSRDDEHDYFMRYIMTQKCNIVKTLVIEDDDYTTIYYNKSKWKDALILYLYHMKKLNIELSSSMELHIFQGILLGYNKDSILFAVYENEMEDFKDTLEKINWDQLSTKHKKLYYTDFYRTLFRNLPEFNEVYKDLWNVISDYKDQFEHDPIMKAFAYGLD